MTNIIAFPGLGIQFTINRIALSIGPFKVYWYGVIIAIGFLLAVWYGMRKAKEIGLKADDLIDLLIWAVPIAIIGYVRLTTPDYFTGMYHTVFGTVVMTLCLVVYGIAFFIAQKIMNIEV